MYILHVIHLSSSSVKTHFQITIIAYFTIVYCSIAPYIHAISLLLPKCEYFQYKFDEKNNQMDFDSHEVVFRVGEK